MSRRLEKRLSVEADFEQLHGASCYWPSFARLSHDERPDPGAEKHDYRENGAKTGKGKTANSPRVAKECRGVKRRSIDNVTGREMRTGQNSVVTTGGTWSNRRCGHCRWLAWLGSIQACNPPLIVSQEDR